MKHIVITGLGGVGGYYGGMLARAYAKSDEVAIHFVARGEHAQEIALNGLQVETPKGSFTVRPRNIVQDAKLLNIQADYVLCCTKSYDLAEAIRGIAPVVGPETVVLPLLNGVDIRSRISDMLPGADVWYGLTYIVAMKMGPGTIRNVHGRGKIFFGTGGKRTEKGDQLEEILREAGIRGEWHDDIVLQMWKKFIIISVSAVVSAYFDLPVLLAFERHADMCDLLLHEITTVARALGIDLPTKYCRRELIEAWGGDKQATTSMHRDFRAGRPTEVDTLCGYVVHEAEQLGIPVPAYKEIYRGLSVGICR